jgi:hypothetical protein
MATQTCLVNLAEVLPSFEPMGFRQRHDRYTAANLARPLLRLARITRRPVWDLIRARKPEVLLLLRLVPPKVRLVMETHLANLKKSQF